MELHTNLTENFKLSEFVESRFFGEHQEKVIKTFSEDTSLLENTKVLAKQLQALRDELQKPVRLNISYRPLWWEKMKGRSGNSQHILGKAADIAVSGVSTKQVAETIERLIKEGKMLDGGLGVYNSFVHYDIGRAGRRWKG